MSFDPNDTESNKVHKLDDVNDRLYRRDLVGRTGHHIDSLHARPVPVHTEWSEKKAAAAAGVATLVKHPSFFRKFFYFSIGFALLAIAIVAVTFWTGGNTVSNNNIEINILGNSFVAGGEQLPLQVEVVNKNSSDLELVDLFNEYNKGGDSTSGSARTRDLIPLGTIGAGKSVTKNIFVTLYGTEGSTETVSFNLQYRLHGSNAIFQKTTTFPVTISSAPVSLSVEAPTGVTPNQTLTFTVKTKSNAKNTLPGMLLNVVYPSGFTFQKSIPDADAYNNVWKLGDLAPGAERDIVITGTVFGTDGEDRAFHIYSGAASAANASKIGVTYNSLLETVTLVKPFITTHILVNGSGADTTPISSSASVMGQVTYANNLSTTVTNAVITLKLSGTALDPASIKSTNGFYDSSKNTITWDSTTDESLASLAPGDSGSLDFLFGSRPLVVGGATIASPSVKLSVSIKGKQASGVDGVSEVTDFEDRTVVVSSDLGFLASVAHASGPFSNTGPVPPKANEPTTYTVTWKLTNSANMLANALVTAALPTYVDWVGTISPSGEPLTYDETTRSLRWNAGQVTAGAGVTASPKTVSFQVRINPSTSQIGTVPNLLLDTAISAQDTFTGQTLSLTRRGVTTALSLEGDSGVVVK